MIVFSGENHQKDCILENQGSNTTITFRKQHLQTSDWDTFCFVLEKKNQKQVKAIELNCKYKKVKSPR